MSGIGDLLREERSQIIELKPKKIFSYEEVVRVLPIILRITKGYREKVELAIQRLDSTPEESEAYRLDKEINTWISEWQSKVEKLGAHVKGVWMADFDSGDGYFCWKFPEEQILYWHGYKDGFSARCPVEKYLEEKTKKVHESLYSSNKSNNYSG